MRGLFLALGQVLVWFSSVQFSLGGNLKGHDSSFRQQMLYAIIKNQVFAHSIKKKSYGNIATSISHSFTRWTALARKAVFLPCVL